FHADLTVNLASRFDEDRTINLTSTAITKAQISAELKFTKELTCSVQPKISLEQTVLTKFHEENIFELVLDIIGTKILTKFHEDRTINVASKMLTSVVSCRNPKSISSAPERENNEEYLRRERERVRRNYEPTSELSDRDKKGRNEQNRAKLRKFYQRKREYRQRQRAPQEKYTSGYESAANDNSERGQLTVRLPIENNKKKAAKRRWKRGLSEANSRIRLLERERSKLMTRYRSTQRSLQRMKYKSTSQNRNQYKEVKLQLLEQY
ncbi:hypothetical protein DPMN_037710, partial [Dreissena polymorpha]